MIANYLISFSVLIIFVLKHLLLEKGWARRMKKIDLRRKKKGNNFWPTNKRIF